VLDSAPLEAAGGLGCLLSKHADAVVDEAAPDPERRAAVERLFRALTDFNVEGKAIRRPQAFRELIAVTDAEPDKLRKIIDALRRDDVSFLTPYSQQPISDNTPVDISHEALIRCWSRLADPQSGWLKHEFDDGLIWRSLLEEAKGFETNKRRILSPATTKERWKWWQERHVNAAWGNALWREFSAGGKTDPCQPRQCSAQAAAIWVNRGVVADRVCRRSLLGLEQHLFGANGTVATTGACAHAAGSIPGV
jgi:hypothetical protein